MVVVVVMVEVVVVVLVVLVVVVVVVILFDWCAVPQAVHKYATMWPRGKYGSVMGNYVM